VTETRVGVVEREVRIAARPEVVFGLLTDAQQMLRWQGLDAEIDATPGGMYRVRMNALGHIAAGRFIEVVPHTRIVFSWGWETGVFPIPPESTTVEITLTPDADGTVLHLRHHGLPPAAEITDAHAGGWARYLVRLATVAEGRDPGPDDWADGRMGEHDPR
jgi:uncharacterized protein YndB with AHSA1/START domain